MFDFNELEKNILSFWRKNKIFEKSIKRRHNSPYFVFFEGPPTTNGHPGIHHLLARSFKDIVCRYKTMRGFRVLRKAGWDTHGLPVELEVEKKLSLKNKKEIEKYGIARFNKKCRLSADSYRKEWEKLTKRMGYWLDMEHPYITYNTNYMETLWWIIKEIYKRKLLYEDYKISPYCPRCGTTLSSHEVAQGYKKIKEPAIYVKFKLKTQKFKDKTYFLVWTTTPWTLPANVALAVNPALTYAMVKVKNEYLILLKERIKESKVEGKILKEFKGKELENLEYEPLFDSGKLDKKSHYVVSANFVSRDEGTGIVHIAPAFGEDDMKVGKKYNLPFVITIDENGSFNSKANEWEGLFFKKADPLIMKNLRKRKLLFREELYEHDYPFCWRCGTPLLYYPRKSWFIKMTSVKKELIENSKKINWVPFYLKKGRFGEWIREVKDWALSRERYWGTPLPVWRCKECNNLKVIGSKKDLLKQKFSTNNYFLLRHGESLSNKKDFASCWPEKFYSPLTERGREEIKRVAKELKNKKIDLIFSSDLLRTRQTSEIIAKELGIKINFDKRLREINIGILNGIPVEELKKFWDPKGKLTSLEYYLKRFRVAPPKGESYTDVEKRVFSFIKEIDKKYKKKNILIVSHMRVLSLLEKMMNGYDLEKYMDLVVKKKEMKTGEIKKLKFRNLPYNEKMELDFHRPYIDEVKFYCQKCHGLMERVPEIIDVWFDSGSVPFAQYHYPFENKNLIDKKTQYPADFIAEAIDQTRGWFYTLLAISTLLRKGTSYKNVVSVGHVVDEKGEKMSKSKGNIVNPWEEMTKLGVDAIRWYFFVVNEPADPKKYSRKDVLQKWQRSGFTLLNCWQFFKTYISRGKFDPFRISRKLNQENILDKWMVSILTGKIEKIEKLLDNFFITKAARELEDLIDQFSNWYLRRSRRRFQNSPSFKESEIFYSFLFNIVLLMAPFIPFTTEFIFQEMRKYSSKKLSESVHLENWPKVFSKNKNKKLEEEMIKAREIVKYALAKRAEKGIKVRQPLASLRIKDREKIKSNKELLQLIKEEVNVKEIYFGRTQKLDTRIDVSLRKEGIEREIIRQIQELRKKKSLTPKDVIIIYYLTEDPFLESILEEKKEDILNQVKGRDILKSEKYLSQMEEFSSLGKGIKIGIRKVKNKSKAYGYF